MPLDIAFVIPSFGPGGAERVASLLCNFWSSRGHTVTAITFDSPSFKPFHALNATVELHQIDAVNVTANPFSRIATNVRRFSRLRSLLRALQPDVMVSFTTEANVVALIAGYGLGIPIVISERNQPDRPGLGRLTRTARRLCYPAAAALVVQTEEIAAWGRRYGVPVDVVPNPIRRMERVSARSPDHKVERNLIAVGRLVPQKGYDILIESFASLVDRFADWQLTIYGEGPERASLQARVDGYGLEKRISLPGVRDDIETVLVDADLFVHPSRYEGYPNALMEALALGCPVVASACPGGTTDLLGGGKYGLLVPSENVEALSAALARMMSSPDLRSSYAGQTPQAMKVFDIDIIGERWLSLLAAVCDVPRRR